MEYTAGEADLFAPPPVGPVKYFGVSVAEGLPILATPGGLPADHLLPGDVVAAEVPADSGGYARLLDNRGWLLLGEEGLEEVHPWAARVIKKPGVARNDAAALAYIKLDDEGSTPLAEHLPLPQRVLQELQRRGVKTASPIQEAVFSRVHRGESMCLQSQTGSGKTLAMMLPLMTAMSEESEWGEGGDKIVVVTSCRELAVQLFADVDSLGFFPQGMGYATLVIVGNLPPQESILRANIIIGTPNELGGVLHKDREIIKQMNTKLRAIVMDEVDDYTTAPRIFGSRWRVKRKRRIYNEKKMTLDGQLGDFDYGRIEWFVKRSLAYSRRKDMQVLAASATLNRNMARKVYRLLRWDPLGRWYNKPPPLLRPLAVTKMDWQATPRMPTIPLHLRHRYVQVIKGRTDTEIRDKHYTRKPYEFGGLPRIKVRSASGMKRGSGARPVTSALAASLLDGLHDTLKGRAPGSALLIICRTVGVTVRDTVAQLHKWGFYEAEAMHNALWEDPKDWPSRWAIKYTYDEVDHSAEIAERHSALSERLRKGEPGPFPVGSPIWERMEERRAAGETTSPLVVGFEGLGRGLHFDGVETVYILGLPRKPEVYLHLAGRVGRLGHRGGKVVSIVPKRGTKVLDAWSSQIGPGVHFEEEVVPRNRSRAIYKMPAEPQERRVKTRRRKRGHGPWANLDQEEEEEMERRLRLPSGIEDGEEEEEWEWEEEEDRRLLLPAGADDYVRLPGGEEAYRLEGSRPRSRLGRESERDLVPEEADTLEGRRAARASRLSKGGSRLRR